MRMANAAQDFFGGRPLLVGGPHHWREQFSLNVRGLFLRAGAGPDSQARRQHVGLRCLGGLPRGGSVRPAPWLPVPALPKLAETIRKPAKGQL